jgi:alpha-beta hydrolase superfamily lysophospholipase
MAQKDRGTLYAQSKRHWPTWWGLAACISGIFCANDEEKTMATYVLVHGAYQGGWIWKLVATRLRAAGHEVYVPTLDGCGERHHVVRPGITVTTQAQEVAQLLFYEDLQAVQLVGTSAGGMVICRAV